MSLYPRSGAYRAAYSRTLRYQGRILNIRVRKYTLAFAAHWKSLFSKW